MDYDDDEETSTVIEAHLLFDHGISGDEDSMMFTYHQLLLDDTEKELDFDKD